MSEVRKFWTVWNPFHKNPPVVQHSTCASAFDEALRLATKRPDQTFYVMEVVGGFAPAPPVEPVPIYVSRNIDHG